MKVGSKNIPVYLIIMALFAGSMMQYALQRYQLIFLGVLIVVLVYEIIKLKRTSTENNKIIVPLEKEVQKQVERD